MNEGEGGSHLSTILKKLVDLGIYDLLVEGGGKVHRSFYNQGVLMNYIYMLHLKFWVLAKIDSTYATTS